MSGRICLGMVSRQRRKTAGTVSCIKDYSWTENCEFEYSHNFLLFWRKFFSLKIPSEWKICRFYSVREGVLIFWPLISKSNFGIEFLIVLNDWIVKTLHFIVQKGFAIRLLVKFRYFCVVIYPILLYWPFGFKWLTKTVVIFSSSGNISAVSSTWKGVSIIFSHL